MVKVKVYRVDQSGRIVFLRPISHSNTSPAQLKKQMAALFRRRRSKERKKMARTQRLALRAANVRATLLLHNEATGRKSYPLSAEAISETRRGSRHWSQKGGQFPYGPSWPMQRKIARNRDNHTCQRCGATEEELGHELSVHHIIPYRTSKDSSPGNLICLCDTNDNGCHMYCEYHPEDCPQPRTAWLLTA